MSLDQLKLSKSGGVYYEGTRVNPIDDPVLFVGAGGTGVDALLRIKNEVQTRMNLPLGDNGEVLRDAPANIAFLAADTDEKILNKTYGVASFSHYGDELIDMRVNDLPRCISHVVNTAISDDRWSWYDPELTTVGGLNGANGIRQIGRFMLIWNIDEIRDKVRAAIQQIRNDVNGSNLRIYLMTGIGGGTGSGTFLDLAFLLRHIAKVELGIQNVQINGFIFTPDLNLQLGGQESNLKTNGFAALKELDYWMSMGEHKQHFIQKYKENYTIDIDTKPFEFCHLITGNDFSLHPVSYHKAMESVGQTLFSFIVQEKLTQVGNTALDQTYTNIENYVTTSPKPYPANYYYLSVGSSQIEIPYTDITTLLACRVFRKLAPIFACAPNQDSINKDRNSMQLSIQGIEEYMNHGVQERPRPAKGASYFAYGDIYPTNHAGTAFYNWLNGDAQKRLAINGQNLSNYYEGMLIQYLERLMLAPQRGPCYAARMIYSDTAPNLIKTLTALRNDCQERVATGNVTLPKVKAEMDNAYVRVQNAGFMQKTQAAKEYTSALYNYYDKAYAYWRDIEEARGIDAFLKRLQRYYDKIFKNLLETLCSLPAIFQDNLTELETRELSAQTDPSERNRYLIRPIQFERKFQEQLAPKINSAATSFLKMIYTNLRQWVGMDIDGIDSAVVGGIDINAAIGNFINTQFREELDLNFETLLLNELPAGQSTNAYLRGKLETLKSSAVPMYQMQATFAGLNTFDFSLISIPENCPRINQSAAAMHVVASNDQPKKSEELNKIQWVKAVAGMPLFAFTDINSLEQAYEVAMKERASRRGVHLRYEWREVMPTPLPEPTWSLSAANSKVKAFSKNYNQEARAAFQTCLKAGILNETQENGKRFITLALADTSDFENITLYGTVSMKMEQLAQLKKLLWGSDARKRKLEPFGDYEADKFTENVQENAIRFSNIVTELKEQATLWEKFLSIGREFEDVALFLHAHFADMFFIKGFDHMLRRSLSDFRPARLIDRQHVGKYADYDIYQSFLNTVDRGDFKENIENQYEIARRKLLDSRGKPVVEFIDEKLAKLQERLLRFESALSMVEEELSNATVADSVRIAKIRDFYSLAIELTEEEIKFLNETKA